MEKATLQQLMIDGVPFPVGFTPAFCTKSEAEGFDGIWHVHNSEPGFKSGEWVLTWAGLRNRYRPQ